MEIILSNPKRTYSEIISLREINKVNGNIKQFASKKGAIEAKIFAINESISSHILSKIKNHFEKANICSLSIYSNNRNNISGKVFR